MKSMSTDPDRAIDLLLSVVHPPDFVMAHPEMKQMMLMGMAAIPPTPPEAIERTAEGIRAFDTYERLPQIRCPVLIVHGEKDILISPANAQILKSRLPQAEALHDPQRRPQLLRRGSDGHPSEDRGVFEGVRNVRNGY